MIPGIPEAEIRSLADFVGYLETHCQLDEFLFRGQQQDWPLLPKIARLTPRGGNTGAIERAMISDLQRKSLPWLEIEPRTEWEWLALAQHHGMATRLLDWSTNPLAALWFAVHKAPVGNAPSVVWLQYHESIPYVNPAECPDPFAIIRTQVFRPRHIARRIASQTAVFTAHASSGERFLPAEQDYTFADCLAKLAVPADAFAISGGSLTAAG